MDDCATFEQKRILRFHVICRLSDLQSINEEYTIEEERDLVRLCAPLNVPINRKDWCTGSIISYAKYNDDLHSITTSNDTLHDNAQNM